ncbi:CSN-associated deubiquitinating enzyme Ubp12 [Ceratobasidium sp. 423]|nr:CSN-associated deubiquitinating enzyme Ubp12 [Ceratobasidium sp. 423]
MLVAYELPIPATVSKPDAASQIVPVLHISSNSAFALPFFVVINTTDPETYSGLKNIVVERYKQWVSTDDVSPEFFELHAFNSSRPGSMETGFRLENSLPDLVDLHSREEEFKGKPLVKPTEALVAVWQPDQRERLFPGNDSIINQWHAHGTRSKRPDEITLSDCLDELSKVEQLGVNDSWYCSRCKQHRQAMKQLQLWSLPTILVLQLKRFEKRAKIDKLVTFPVNELDLSDRVGGEEYVYDLFAVDEHKSDVMSTGAYTTRAKNPSDGAWYYFQDSLVTPTTPEAAINPGAYVLFYRRRGVPPGEALNKVKRSIGSQ